MAKKLRKSVAEGLRKKLSKELKLDKKRKTSKDSLEDLFNQRGKHIGGVERIQHDANVLRLEWAIKYASEYTPKNFLMHIKDYTEGQAAKLLNASGGASKWRSERKEILDQMTATTVKRHVDLAADVQGQHIRAAKMGLAKTLELMSFLKARPVLDADGKPERDYAGNVILTPFNSRDLVNSLTALEKAQGIYRKAMGLATDEGLTQILERVTINNTQINGVVNQVDGPSEASKTTQSFNELEYDDLMEFVELRREQRKLAESQEVIDVEEE